MKCYYAHCMSIYGTPQENRDVATLKELGFDVVNPNSPEIQAKVQEMKDNHASSHGIMVWFSNLVETCDALAFRAVPGPGLGIPAGVAKEVDKAIRCNMPVFELPCGIIRRGMSVEETREYLREAGQR